MSRTPARFTQADVARALRAAQQSGAGKVRLLPDGTIEIVTQAEPAGDKQDSKVAPEREIVL